MNPPTSRIPFVPAGLRARLTVTVVAASLLLFLVVFGVTYTLISAAARAATTSDAHSRLAAIARTLELETRELDSYVVNYTEWQTFYDETLRPDAAFIAEELDPWLRTRTNADVVLWMDDDSTPIFAFGSDIDIDAVRELLEGASARLAGPVTLPSGPHIIVARPVVGAPSRPPAGYLAIARPLALAQSGPLLPPDLSVSPPSATSDAGLRPLAPVTGFSQVRGRFESGNLTVVAHLDGVDGRPAALITFTAPPAMPLLTGSGGTTLPLALGLFSLLFGLVLGSTLARLIAEPVERFSSYLQDQGYRAIEGLPFDAELEIDQRLPEELRSLGTTIRDLLTQLALRQAELKRANEAILAAESALRSIVNDSREVKLLVRDDVIEVANPAAEHCLAQPLGSIIKHRIDEVFRDRSMSDEDGTPLMIHDLITRALTQPVTVRCDEDGEERWMQVTVVETSPPGSYLLTAHDITEQHRLEQLRSEIISLVSHDLRTPLTVITGYLDVLARPLTPEKHERVLASMREAVERMRAMVEDLLDASRSERALAPARKEPISLGDLADAVAEATRVSHGREVAVVKRRKALVSGDPDRLRQALDNLVGNALKHAGDGEISIVVTTSGSAAILAVEDDGPGIPAEEREAIFERFYRRSSAHGREGIGLGLHIVKVIAETHGGRAYVEDGPGGKGARFVVELPLASPTARRTRAKRRPAQSADSSA